jgi:hypothetical protein
MSNIALTDDLRDDDELIAALLGVNCALERWRQWAGSVECAQPTAADSEPDADFLSCLLGIAALVAQLEPALSAWAARSVCEPELPKAAPWRGLLR